MKTRVRLIWFVGAVAWLAVSVGLAALISVGAVMAMTSR